MGGDLIVAIDDQPVREFDDIVVYLARDTKVGQTVVLTVLRQGNEEKLRVTLEARPESETQGPSLDVGRTGTAWLGISGLSVTPEIAAEMQLPSDQQGVLIQQVEQDSPASEAGLRGSYKPITINGTQVLIGGDVITALDEHAVKRIENLRDLVGQAQPGQQITLRLLREGERIDVAVVLSTRSEMTP